MINKSKKSLPYNVTHCVESNAPFPTYTEGLTYLGLPEFIINAQAFGGEGNTAIIFLSYKYFSNPKNLNKLKAILNGKIIKLTGKELSPIHLKDSPYIYCYREAPPSFEGLQQAYGKGFIELVVKKGWRFVQIWVDGDDFALTDDYYRPK